jgi:hypothetical protein
MDAPATEYLKMADIDFDAIGDEVYRQLPGFHPLESAAGAGLGAGAGGLYHLYKKH